MPGDKFKASLSNRAVSASWKASVETPRRYSTGNSASKRYVRRDHFGRIAEEKQTRSSFDAAPRPRIFTRTTLTALIRSGAVTTPPLD